MGGHVGALLGADPLGALVGQVGGEPEDPRPDHDRRGRPRRARRRRSDVAGHATASRRARRRCTSASSEQQATPAASRAYDAQPPRPNDAPGTGRSVPVRVQPALALRLVGLPPQQRDADDADQDRPEDRAAAEHRLEQQDRAEAERGQGDHRPDVAEPADPARTPAAAGGALEAGGTGLEVGVGRQHQPQAGVQDDAEPAEERGEHEADPHPQHRDREVPGQPGGDAAEDRLLGVAGRAPHRRAGPGRRQRWRWLMSPPSSHSAQVPDHEGRPRADPEPP